MAGNITAFISQNNSFSRPTLLLSEGLNQVLALLLDGRFQTLFTQTKVSECVQGESPLLPPLVTI